ncbi:suppressor Mra1 family protein [Vulcanisaeta distributa]|uniref:Ribosomal RNA small subunit methyltransferase Nep1 n=1 Tax=Vulcanisaeta distributa (strain DSM 14429 / JCM 11212 / NBRC 100878 / IC-017) TaxID=572478 RepID=E1QV05_VULDI|nr:suppressor Mra1 family protein [Vulcanisaeta distributa]ADN51196.1 Suppressor Mra1 family protein [Vulcanisaeta distributa DSM 14429]
MDKVILLLTEASLETIPKELLSDPVIIRDAKRRGVNPRYLILDRARHHRAMTRLPNAEKRGRPDILHQALLLIQGSLLARNNLVKTYVHTVNDLVIDVDPEIRPPRNYDNFIGLMSQLFEVGRVPPVGKPLMRFVNGINYVLNTESPDRKILLDDVKGKEVSLKSFIDYVKNFKRPLIMIGAFPRGSFEERTYGLADDVLKIGKYIMDTSSILCRLLTALEIELGLIS